MTECASTGNERFTFPPPYCGGCGEDSVSAICRGSLQRQGIQKAHWECWSECNLSCPFCFRTNGQLLDTEDVVRLLRALSTGAIRAVVFAGGDPSLRPDLPEVAAEALMLGLAVQIQTNAQHVTRSFLSALRNCEYVGLSLDGPDAPTHDGFRGKPGNFRHVISLLDQLDRLGVPVSVRTVVGKANHRAVPQMARLVASYSNVICWKLLEFTAVGSGFVNRDRYALPSDAFERTVLASREGLGGSDQLLDVLRNVDKVGIYMMISSQGLVYGTTETALARTGRHQYIGSVLSDHLGYLAQRIPFSSHRRIDRRLLADTGVRSSDRPSVG